jgi:hypothetical protein
LTNFTVATNNPAYSSEGGVLFDASQSTLIQFPGSLGGNYTVPNSVTNIGDWAFRDCSGLNGIYFAENAPSVGLSAFSGALMTIYYLPNTTGWGPTFAGRPTALWLPAMQTSDASFGVQTNQFGFTIQWANGQTAVVEACTNVANPVWNTVATNTLTGGTAYFSDPDWTNYSISH